MTVFSAIADASAQAFADLALGLPPDTEARLVRARIEPLPDGWQVVNDIPLLQMELRDYDGQPHDGPAIVTLGPPVKLTDSMTSGYNVPCAKNAASPTRAVQLSNTSIKLAPIILRLVSGSDTPARRVRNNSDASSWISGML